MVLETMASNVSAMMSLVPQQSGTNLARNSRRVEKV